MFVLQSIILYVDLYIFLRRVESLQQRSRRSAEGREKSMKTEWEMSVSNRKHYLHQTLMSLVITKHDIKSFPLYLHFQKPGCLHLIYLLVMKVEKKIYLGSYWPGSVYTRGVQLLGMHLY